MVVSEHTFEYARRPMGLAVQRSFDDLGTPLIEQTFVVFDLETTGGSPAASKITEIGAVKVRGGEIVGEFASLVDPGVPIPIAITTLTGITNEMVASAPPIESLLPALLEFIGDAVLVAHNASFDVGFLRATCARLGYPPPQNRVICTVRLGRRLVRDEVPNLKLATLAHAMRARTTPSHRALDDARATTDVFHAFLELCGRWGVQHTDDLLWFQTTRGHPSYRKIRLVDDLPRARGVYLFRDAGDRVLYVGKATDLRTRVRSYFGDDRKHIDDLLRALERVDHIECRNDLEASVLEARLIRSHSPPFNRAQRGRSKHLFLKLTEERFPRLSTTRNAGAALGPLPARTVQIVREAFEEATDVRTCTMRITKRTAQPPCVRGQIGHCPSPCADPTAESRYEPIVATLRRALDGDATEVLGSLESRIERLSGAQLFEQAAATRDRVGALVDAVRTARAVGALLRAGRAVLSIGGVRARLENGTLASIDDRPLPVPPDGHPDEPRLIAAWLARNRARIVLDSCEGEFAQPTAGGRALAQWFERMRTLRARDDERRVAV